MSCRCECGYRCGGPGVCKLSLDECLSTQDGNHFVQDCEHRFDGEIRRIDEYAYSVVCSRCGLSEMAHDMRCGP